MGDKRGAPLFNEDELLAKFDQIPTVAASLAATDQGTVRKAMMFLVMQAVEAGADPDELAETLRAIDPHQWGSIRRTPTGERYRDKH